MNALLAVLLGVLALLATAFAYQAYAAAREITRDDGRLRLNEVARALGLALRSPDTEAGMHAHALAVRRCVACRSRSRCDRLAAARDWHALREICPNRAYLDGLRG